MRSRKFRVRLTKANGGTVEIVGGPRPYLWIGDSEGRCVGFEDRGRQLRALAKALTEAADAQDTYRRRR